MADDEALKAFAIYWPQPGVAETSTLTVPAPGADEVLLDLTVTVTSPGTERARFLGLPNASIGFPHVPGYLGAGTVARAAAGFEHEARVVAERAPHQSMATVIAPTVHPIPDGVSTVDAALLQLGLTALHGLSRGEYVAGEPLVVVGAGLLGAIVRRLALALGSDCVVVARSLAKRWSTSTEVGVTFVTAADTGGVRRCSLVIDASGTAEGLSLAARLAADGGRVVILGSPRTPTAEVPVGAVYEHRLRVVGAHVDSLERDASRSGRDLKAEHVRRFFGILAEGGVTFADLLDEHHPSDAPFVYRRLVSDPAFVGAAFVWDAPHKRSLRLPQSPTPRRHDDPVGFALVGCGDVGALNAGHISDAQGARLVACFDAVRSAASDLAALHDAAVSPSVEDLLKRDDVEAVMIATPHDTHEALAVAALEAGKQVLLEKPLAADLAGATGIAAAASRSAGSAAVLFPLRHDRRFRLARAAIEAGLLGSPHAGLACYLVDKPPSYYFGGYSGRTPSTWRRSRDRSGGGVLMMNVLHHLDAVRALLSAEPDVVYAATSPSEISPDVEDFVTLIVHFGPTCVTFVGDAALANGPGESIRLWGGDGQLTVLPEFSISSRLGYETDRAGDLSADPKVLSIEAFAENVRNGTPCEVSIQDALVLQAVVSAAYRSAASGVAVAVADVLGTTTA